MASLSKAEIAALIPHGGAMVLLESVVSWTADTITCRATSHRDPANPLRRRAQLPTLAGIEYAAQAMAIHGALSSGRHGERRVLGTVRDVRATSPRLDEVESDLIVEVRLLGQASAGAQYSFAIAGDDDEILSGQATVFAL